MANPARTPTTERMPRLVILRGTKLPMVSPEAPVGWVHVACVGPWLGYPQGPIEFTRKDFEDIVANFKRQDTSVLVDFEHASVSDPPVPAPAAGWIHDLDIRGNELWAKVEFAHDAADWIKHGKYKFSSPVVLFDAIDRRTAEEIGAELHSLALTNVPFQTDLHPIVLSRRGRVARRKVALMKKKDLLAKLDEVLKDFPDDLDEQQMQQVIGSVMALEAAKEGTPDEEPMSTGADDAATLPPLPDAELSQNPAKQAELAVVAPAEETAINVAVAEELLAALREATGFTDDAQVLAAVRDKMPELQALLAGTAENGTPAEATRAVASRVLESEVVTLRKQLKAYQDEAERAKDAAAAAEVEALVKAGRILDVNRKDYVELARKAPDLFVKLTKDAPAIVPVGKTLPAEKPKAGSDIELEPEIRTAVEMMVQAKIPRERAIIAARKARDKRAAQQMTGGH
jgi:phage I-like protein